jgi:hypothetical protein
MAKLFLYFTFLAFGAAGSSSVTHAAVRLGDARLMSLNSNVQKLPCTHCAQSRAPDFGDLNTLNPQPLPPKTYGNGLPLRR